MEWSIIILVAILCHLIVALWLYSKQQQELLRLQERLLHLSGDRESMQQLLKQQQQEQQEQRTRFDQHQIKSLKLIQDSLQQAVQTLKNEVNTALTQHGQGLNKEVQKLTQTTQERLGQISQEVDRRLNVGFEKSQATFIDVVKRLAIIDQAQKKITELSSNVVSLQALLNDKRARGAFGEVQLATLIRNVIPESHFSLQHTLSNGKRVDCLLFLPEPTGNIAVDAKFPLETYRQLMELTPQDAQRSALEQQFRQDIKKHIQDVADKYLIANETASIAILFIPAEAIFAEIHAHYPDLVSLAQRLRICLTSPTTLVAILNTMRAVLKDAQTREQVDVIQKHLIALSKDFSRFQERMDKLKTHIAQANDDVEKVHISSQKISGRFNKIEQVELGESSNDTLLEPAED